jgi:hypothetical protein
MWVLFGYKEATKVWAFVPEKHENVIISLPFIAHHLLESVTGSSVLCAAHLSKLFCLKFLSHHITLHILTDVVVIRCLQLLNLKGSDDAV